jgi:hypothetical protein
MITVIKTGNILEATHSEGSIDKIATNTVTGSKIVMFRNSEMVESDLLSENEELYQHSMFDTINGASVATQEELYTELKSLL